MVSGDFRAQAVGPGRASPRRERHNRMRGRWIRGDRIGLEFAHETRLDCSADRADEGASRGHRPQLPRYRSSSSAENRRKPEPVTRRAAPRGPPPAHLVGRAAPRYQSCAGARAQHFGDRRDDRVATIPCSSAARQSSSSATTDSFRRRSPGWSATRSGLRFRSKFDMAQLARSRPEVAAGEMGCARLSPVSRIEGRAFGRELGKALAGPASPAARRLSQALGSGARPLGRAAAVDEIEHEADRLRGHEEQLRAVGQADEEIEAAEDSDRPDEPGRGRAELALAYPVRGA